MNKMLPEPLYCCANNDCCAEYTWPAEDLHWSDRCEGWYCDNCWDVEPLCDDEQGVSLADELTARGMTR